MQRPNIILSSQDVKRLENMLETLDETKFPNIDALFAELARATVVEPKDMPDNVVTMNSTVVFRVEESHKEFSLTLVYPRDSDGAGDKISILAPVGSALLGLSEGDSISWPKPGGGQLNVRIIKVIYQPERAGDFQL